MTLQDLADQLTQEAMSFGQITVDDALLGRNDIDNLILLHLDRSNILLTVPRAAIVVTSDPSPHIFVRGSIPSAPQDSFLNLQGYAATITFTQVDQVMRFVMDITLDASPPRVPAWTFPVSYPALSGTGVELLPASNQHFLFASDTTPLVVEAGLNYTANVTLTGPFLFFLPLQSWLIPGGGTTMTLAGAMTPALGCFQLTAYTAPNPSTQNLTLFSASNFQLAFGIETMPDPDNVGYYIPSANFGCTMDVIQSSGSLSGLKARAMLSSDAVRNVLQLVIAPADGGLVSLYDLGNLMGGATWDALFSGSFGQSLATCFDSFGLVSWGGSFCLTPTPYFASSVLTVGSDPRQSYVIVPGSIVLERLLMQWIVISPMTSGPQSFSLDAVLRLGDDLRFEVQVTFGASVLSVMGELVGELPVDLNAWCTSLLEAFGYTDGLPQAVSDFFGGGFVLTNITVTLGQTATNTDFGISLVGEVPLTTEPTLFAVDMGFSSTAAGWDVRFACDLEVGPSSYVGQLQVSSVQGGANTWRVSARWEDRVNPIGFNEIAYGLGFELPPIPPTLDLDLVAASFEYDSGLQQMILTAESSNWGKAVLMAFAQTSPTDGSVTWVFTFIMEIRRQVQTGLQPLINLSNIPLINMQLSGANTLGVEAKVLVTSAPISATLAAALNGQMPAGYPLFPVAGFAGTMGFALVLDFAGLILPISLGLDGESDTTLTSTAAQSTIGTPPAGSTAPVVATPLPPTNDGTIWVNVQKAFGPVLIEQVGVRFENGLLWFLMNADLRLAGLSMSMMGLRAGTPLDTFAPQFDIDGLGIDYKTVGFEFGGALLNMRLAPPDFLYAGSAVLTAAGISASVTGSYGMVTSPTGQVTTMFLFGQIKGLALGNPCFLVTGLAAGVGYNSRLRIPGVAEVGQFPFVTSLSSTAEPSTPMAMLNTLMRSSSDKPAWVTAVPGQFWVAAGVTFSSFNFLSVNALAVVVFGNSLEVALLGQATAQFPKTGRALGRIQLNLSASYRSTEGALSIAAILTTGSYVLDPNAKITGGFAFASWFKGIHAGDFVLTIGGYHPRYSVPAWYPQVPRLGINWTPATSVALTGSAYLAMTPSAMMLGASLSLNYVDGKLRAWFIASFDALVKFVPFAFDLSVGVTVGVSYTQDTWFGTKTVTAELGANLSLWGPPTGGSIRVEWWIISFTINFGATRASSSAANTKATWTDFTQLLPPSTQCISISASAGLTASLPQSGAPATWLVSSDNLTIDFASAVPLSTLIVLRDPNGNPSNATVTVATSPLVNILPMGLSGVQSQLTVSLKWYPSGSTSPITVDLSQWGTLGDNRNVPKALWGSGTGTTTSMPTASQLVPNQMVGGRITAPPTRKGSATGQVPLANLMLAAAGTRMFFPIRTSGYSLAPAPVTDDDALYTMIYDINLPPVKQTRQANLADLRALGFVLDTSATVTNTVDLSMENYFDAEPLLLSPTSHT